MYTGRKRTQSQAQGSVPWYSPAAKRKYVPKKTQQYGKGYQPGAAWQADRPELKWYDTGVNLTALANAPDSDNPAYSQVLTFNNIAQGDSANGTRNGNKICVKKITVRGKVEVDANSDAVWENVVSHGHLCRVVLYIDNSPNGSVPTFDEFFHTDPTNAGQLYDYNRIPYKDRFKVIMDKWLAIPPSYVVYDGHEFHTTGNYRHFKKSFSLDLPILFSDGTNNQSAIQRNNIGMWIMSDATTASFTHIKYSYRARVRYTDY